MGENGSGKTTLVKLLTGELVPQDGFRSAHRSVEVMMEVGWGKGIFDTLAK